MLCSIPHTVRIAVVRLQAKVGNLLAMLLPKQQLVPAVDANHLHPNPEEVS